MMSLSLLHSIVQLSSDRASLTVLFVALQPYQQTKYLPRFFLYKLLADFISSMVEPSVSISAILYYSPPKTSFPLPYIK